MIGEDAPCYVIAEAGSNHNRDLDMAFKLIDAAVEAKVNAVKFQTFSAETIASQADIPLTRIDFAGASSPYELFKKIELPREWQKDLFTYASEKGISFLSTPFDEEAVDQLLDIGIEAFKIASFELNHFPLLRHVAQTGRPVLLSTGMATLDEIEEALDLLEKEGCRSVALLHCGIGYPLDFADVNLRAMSTMSQFVPCPVGYSDHTFGIAVSLAAVARGARLLEKHFTMDRQLSGPDHPFALEPQELSEMVRSIRCIESALGCSVKGPAESELEFKERGRRSLFAKVSIRSGEIIRRDMIAVLRPAAGLHPRCLEMIVGRATAKDIREHEPLTWDCISRS
ncbi:MAG: N-acetylneuraminate synthase family protein [Phycisphaerales bacterium]|nr:MAG: N-acetylneuraminate synthase family protein [Phycisphaerales bacterium]